MNLFYVMKDLHPFKVTSAAMNIVDGFDIFSEIYSLIYC